MNRRGFLLSSSVGLVMMKPVMLMAQVPASQRRAVADSRGASLFHTPYGNLVLKGLLFSPHDLRIEGSVTNETDRHWRWVSFLLRMSDPSGERIQHDDSFDGCFYVKDIDKGETQPITDAAGNPARLLLRPEIEPASVTAELQPERSYFDSKYVFRLDESSGQKPNNQLSYEDERINIHFDPGTEGLSFALTNHSPEPGMPVSP